MIRTLLTIAVLALSGTAAMADIADDGTTSLICVEAGTMAPEFSAVTAAGEPVDFAAIAGARGAVVVFSRSLDWCPYCKAQALELETITADLAEAGWSLNVITYDSPETLTDFATEHALSYTLLSDTDSAMIDAFGLRNTRVTAGSRFDGIPNPAIIYIKANGEVAGVQKEERYQDRPETVGIVQLVNLINQGAPAAP
ncbi:MAG: peroxiredoxin family protein [Hyphomonadaceae bacterium]|nr:peroxiredoxin family protein [Hyphomonadaceae bacterium]